MLKYDPKTKKNTVLIKNLHFANGVELADDESFIIVSETMKYRIHKYVSKFWSFNNIMYELNCFLLLFTRYYLKGPKAGKSEIFIDGLPGMPDNIKKIGKGSFYVPLVFGRNPIIDKISNYPTIRMMIAKFLGVMDVTFQTIDLFYPNVYCKKAAHWVNI